MDLTKYGISRFPDYIISWSILNKCSKFWSSLLITKMQFHKIEFQLEKLERPRSEIPPAA